MRVSPRGRVTFLCTDKEKVTQRKPPQDGATTPAVLTRLGPALSPRDILSRGRGACIPAGAPAGAYPNGQAQRARQTGVGNGNCNCKNNDNRTGSERR